MKLPYISKPNGVTNEDYHHSEKFKKFISSSKLKQILFSPKWFKYALENEEEQEEIKDWMLEGGIYHDILCSLANTGNLDSFNNSSAIFKPPVNESTGKVYGYNTNKFRDAYESFQQDNIGKTIYSSTEYNNSLKMINELTNGSRHLSHIINELLKIGKAEISIFTQHKVNDLVQYDIGYFKIRKDLTTRNKIIDWKTVARKTNGKAPIKAEDFARVITDKGYAFTAAMYQYFEWLVTGKWKSFYWVVQEKEPPYDFNIVSGNEWAFEVQGGELIGIKKYAEDFLRCLEQYLYCLEKNEWEGVSIFTAPDFRGRRIATARIPAYEFYKENEFYN